MLSRRGIMAGLASLIGVPVAAMAAPLFRNKTVHPLLMEGSIKYQREELGQVMGSAAPPRRVLTGWCVRTKYKDTHTCEFHMLSPNPDDTLRQIKWSTEDGWELVSLEREPHRDCYR